MKRELRTLLLSGTLATGTLGSAFAFAQTGAQTGGAQDQAQTQPQTQMQEQTITGSVPVAQGMAQYADMATVSLQDAVSAAQQATGISATPTSVELEVEDGFLVWAVELGNQEVIVDAGNGSVLQTETENESEGMESEDEGEEHEGAENESGESEGAEDDD